MSLAEQHVQDWNRAAAQAVDAVEAYTNAIFDAYLPQIVYERYGRIIGRVAASQTAVVQLLDAPGVGTIRAQYGTPAIQPSDIGKRARIWERVTFTTRPSGRPLIADRSYTVDTVLGGP